MLVAGLPDLASKYTGCPAKFKFQVNNRYYFSINTSHAIFGIYPVCTDVYKRREHKKEESEKSGLKINIEKTRCQIMASGPIISWQIDGETMETVTEFYWAQKSLQMVTTVMKLKDACSLEEKL